MKRIILFMAVLLIVSSAYSRDLIKISATKKTADQRKSGEQSLPRGTTSRTDKKIYYRFDLRCLTTELPSEVTAEWKILVEKMDGRLEPATTGQKKLHLEFGKTVEIQTDTFSLQSRDWSLPNRSGSASEDIAGYGIRVLGADGAVLVENYQPNSIQSEISWEKKKEETRERPESDLEDRRLRRRRIPNSDRRQSNRELP